MKPEIALVVTPEFEQVGVESSETLMAVASLTVNKFEVEERSPLDIVAVIDRSGSMSGEKIELAKAALIFMVEQFKPGDKFGLVTFDDKIVNEFELQKMSNDNKAIAKKKIESVKPGGSTNLSGGMLSGFEMLQEGRETPKDETKRVESVLVFTDGEANNGIKDKDGLVGVVNDFLTRNDGVNARATVCGFGFGASHNEKTIRAISEAGNGTYYYVERNDDLPVAFADCLGGLMSVAAQNVKLTFDATNGAKLARVYADAYKVKVEQDGNKQVVTLGDLFSEERKDVVFAVTPPADDTGALATLTLDYYACAVSKSLQTKATLTVTRPNTTPPHRTGAVVVEEQRARLLTMDALKAARAKGDASAFKEAQEVLREARHSLEQLSCAGSSPLVKELQEDLEECRNDCASREQYRRVGGKKMAMFGHGHAKQRAPMSSALQINKGKRYYDSADHYSNKVQAMEKRKAEKAAKAAEKQTIADNSTIPKKPLPVAPAVNQQTDNPK